MLRRTRRTPRSRLATAAATLGCLVWGAVAAVCQPLAAEEPRYELGQRLRAVEAAWEANRDPQARDRGAGFLHEAVRGFFGLSRISTAQSLDRARVALDFPEGAPPGLEAALALVVDRPARLFDVGTESVPLTLARLYPVESPEGPPAVISLILFDGEGREVAAAAAEIAGLPRDLVVPVRSLGEGDYRLAVRVAGDGFEVELGERTLSFADDPAGRVARLRAAVGPRPPLDGTAAATLADRVVLLERLLAGTDLETDFPATRLLAEAEIVLQNLERGDDPALPMAAGEHWLTLADELGTARVRLYVPEAIAEGPRPLVLALHGAGGSENLFFDAYGRGRTVELCRDRGWLMLAPRATPLGPPMTLQRLIDALDEVTAIDRERVALVGHSMGAAQALRAVGECRPPPRAVAALGGGGWFGFDGDLSGTAFLVAVGSRDFALPAAQSLSEDLARAGAGHVVFREYAGIEHMMIVQETAKEVFAFFDESLGK